MDQSVLLDSECHAASVFHNGTKINGECGSNISFHMGKMEARQFYIMQLGWYASIFKNVNWLAHDKSLTGKPDTFKKNLPANLICSRCGYLNRAPPSV